MDIAHNTVENAAREMLERVVLAELRKTLEVPVLVELMAKHEAMVTASERYEAVTSPTYAERVECSLEVTVATDIVRIVDAAEGI